MTDTIPTPAERHQATEAHLDQLVEDTVLTRDWLRTHWKDPALPPVLPGTATAREGGARVHLWAHCDSARQWVTCTRVMGVRPDFHPWTHTEGGRWHLTRHWGLVTLDVSVSDQYMPAPIPSTGAAA